MINTSAIIQFIRSKKYSPMSAAELAEYFEINDEEYKPFCNLLHSMEFSGDIVMIKQKQYADPKKVHLMVGTLDGNQRGFGFVVPVKKEDGEDVYVPRRRHRVRHAWRSCSRAPLRTVSNSQKTQGKGEKNRWSNCKRLTT